MIGQDFQRQRVLIVLRGIGNDLLNKSGAALPFLFLTAEDIQRNLSEPSQGLVHAWLKKELFIEVLGPAQVLLRGSPKVCVIFIRLERISMVKPLK